MAPLLNTLISRIVFLKTKKRQPDLPRPASFTFSEGDFPGGHQLYEGYSTQASSLGSSPIKAEPPVSSSSPEKGYSAQPSVSGNGPSRDFSAGSHQSERVQSAASPDQAASSSQGKVTHPQHSPSRSTQDQTGMSSQLSQKATTSEGASQSRQGSQAPEVSDAGQTSSTSQVHNSSSSSDTQHRHVPGTEQQSTKANVGGSSIGQDTTAGDGQVSSSDGQVSSSDGQRQEGGDQVSTNASEPQSVDRADLVHLVQGTDHLISMLQARDLS